ncbi:DUF2972 domain-containing protein, partial [Campylobacter sp. RM9939]|uniref:DUF2972 domain-containing protein n=1 Tax=Campylobacter molothri TaxID=1032242 RepID=UPI001D9720C9|nr:DUF2972 domain-containing protein [Campylobacter sp. RM10536]MBZ7953225.1 DUF2972 domain-containing protein [Campylobacter sp. RM9939]MBZ7957595.1 DUF2972 domain-containing protein [Campylobacter sp. RM10541]
MWFFNCCSGSNAMYRFFEYCNITAKTHPALTGEVMYKDMYFYMNNSKYSIAVIPPFMQNFYHNDRHMNDKLLHLYHKATDVIFIARDPISICKTSLNHINNPKVWESITFDMRYVDLNKKSQFSFPQMFYAFSEGVPNIEDLYKVINFGEFLFTIDRRIAFLKKNIKNIKCLDFSQINYDNAYNTFLKLSKDYNFSVPKNPSIFQNRVDSDNGSLIVLPVELFYVYRDRKITFLVTTEQLIILNPNKDKYKNITANIINFNFKYRNVIVLLNFDDWKLIKDNKNLFFNCRKKIQEYLIALEKNEEKIIKNALTERDILNYLKENKAMRIALKKYIDNNFNYVRENHPEYISKWKYYQEFEKMCEELDKQEVDKRDLK